MTRVLMIDLDGVLNDYDGDYEPFSIPPPKPNVKEFLNKLSKNYKLVLFSARPCQPVKIWLNIHGLNSYFAEVTSIKRPAHAYIDDRAITFKGSYDETLKDLDNFAPYWKDSHEDSEAEAIDSSNLF